MNQRTQKLHDIMRENNLTAVDVATLLGREVITVRIWRCATDNRVIPEDTLTVLQMKVEAAKKAV